MKMVQTVKNDSWSATLILKSPNHSTIIDSLKGEGLDINTINEHSTINIESHSLKDLRAYWNTLLRSLQAADSVLNNSGDNKYD